MIDIKIKEGGFEWAWLDSGEENLKRILDDYIKKGYDLEITIKAETNSLPKTYG